MAIDFLDDFILDPVSVVNLLAVGGVLIALWWSKASGQRFRQVVARLGDVPSQCRLSGEQIAKRLLAGAKLTDVDVRCLGTRNCYAPWKREVRLNSEAFHSNSLSSLAAASHEVGHAAHFARRHLALSNADGGVARLLAAAGARHRSVCDVGHGLGISLAVGSLRSMHHGVHSGGRRPSTHNAPARTGCIKACAPNG